MSQSGKWKERSYDAVAEESEGWMASVVQAVNQAFVVAPLCPSLSVGRWVPYLRSGSLWLLPAG